MSRKRQRLETVARACVFRSGVPHTIVTNAHGKKWANNEAMLALWGCRYNSCRKHQTLKTTPAVAAGLASEPWTLETLMSKSATAAV